MHRLNQHERYDFERGLEAGLSNALGILEALAEVMLEREGQVGRKPNYARRIRIKAYQVAGRRVQTQLTRQRRILAKLARPGDQLADEQRLRAQLKDLAL